MEQMEQNDIGFLIFGIAMLVTILCFLYLITKIRDE